MLGKPGFFVIKLLFPLERKGTNKMALMELITKQAMADVKTIVLPEDTEPRTVEAAGIIAKRGIANVILLGDEEEIKKVGRRQRPFWRNDD